MQAGQNEFLPLINVVEGSIPMKPMPLAESLAQTFRGRPPFTAALAEIVRERRSIRDFHSEPIPPSEILDLLSLVARAPSAWNLQPWRFVVVTEQATKEALRDAANGQKQVVRAPVVIVIYSDMVDALARIDDALHPSLPPDLKEKTRETILAHFAEMPAPQRDQWGRNQANIALGYLLLILESHGYGSSPMLGFDPPKVRALLHLPDHAEVVALVAFGRPAEEGRTPHRHNTALLTRWMGANP